MNIFTWIRAAYFEPTIDLPEDNRTSVQRYIDYMEYYHHMGGGLKQDCIKKEEDD